MHPAAREPVQMRRLQIRMAHEGQRVVAVVVREDEQEVARGGGGLKGEGAPTSED